ncbi:hypothetical protein VTN00DRAFT_7319 [Thermoascus crustaceus]|uniref:uncharacterized protein n=1 Tax=Thermoascus crustaceus TaxID=5088 RepID=UPI003742CDB8
MAEKKRRGSGCSTFRQICIQLMLVTIRSNTELKTPDGREGFQPPVSDGRETDRMHHSRQRAKRSVEKRDEIVTRAGTGRVSDSCLGVGKSAGLLWSNRTAIDGGGPQKRRNYCPQGFMGQMGQTASLSRCKTTETADEGKADRTVSDMGARANAPRFAGSETLHVSARVDIGPR